MTLVGKTEGAGEVGERFFGKHQRAAAHPHPHLAHVIVRRTLIHGAKLALEGAHREAAGFRELLISNRLREMLAHEADRLAQGRIRGRALALRGERTRDTRRPDDVAAGVVQGDFRGHAPTRGVVKTPHELDARKDPLAAQHALVVDAVLVGERLAAKIVIAVADDFFAGFQPEIEYERNTHPLISPRDIFHPQRQILEVIKQLDHFRRRCSNPQQTVAQRGISRDAFHTPLKHHEFSPAQALE